ncbi:MAG: DUF1080 domain-containing protein [Akkermansiaceae bacterium]|nr:DUF1080 domain-containing protein [Akkermansiaceae bacterium]NNM28124.1 DUF1080 domain-containing protein [Akkermansiaceae bacterium]
MKKFHLLFPFLAASLAAEPVSLFDGKTLNGWEVRKGEEAWWSVQDGALTGGSMEKKVPHNTFLASEKRYANFELKFKVRLVKGEGFMNSGIQVRSIRVKGGKSHEMSGYQVDAGINWWGKIYDESRRNKVIAEPVDPAALAKVVKDWDWNDYVIRCEGPRIRSWINGVAALDFTEKDPNIPLEGLIGFQAHGGGKFFVQFKDITIEELPPTPGAKRWPPTGPQTPAQEQSFFRVPEGFEVELVASEEQGVGKPITVAWDAKGRLWTMTAYEYPVDANESRPKAEALYARGGSDKVLVIDEPNGPGPHTPRVFAEGLAIPLGMLPIGNGALVQYGSEIRFYEDKNGDGKADGHRTVLNGFGIQDSHLFPHQFERAPGGWIYVAQGLFNRSNVVRPDGKRFASGPSSVPFNACKLARFRPDGSDFEILTHGPNNIWGLATSRHGEVFLQEANDLGIPVSEFVAGMHYKTGSKDLLRPYAVFNPPSLPGSKMGGTGLSGLAIAEDHDSPFAKGSEGRTVFYLANPITNRIQVVMLHRDKDGKRVYEKQEDFLFSDDPWFRPVAIHFGPDGALYVVDWYNKIISHNEVSRAHPDRDKTRGRIWRIKAKGAATPEQVDLTVMNSKSVIGLLGGKNARLARMAWQELGDRGEPLTSRILEPMVSNAGASLDLRLGALWALEEMRALQKEWLVAWAKDPNAHFRYEVVRAAGDLQLDEKTFLGLLNPSETDFRVRCAFANSLRRQRTVTPAMCAGLAGMVRPPVDSKEAWTKFESEFERYLIRWALEKHSAATAKALEVAGKDLGAEARVFMTMGLGPQESARRLLGTLPDLKRPLVKSELELLGSQLRQPAVAEGFRRILADEKRKVPMLQALLQFDPGLAADPALRKAVLESARTLSDAGDLVPSLARHFRLAELAPVIRERLDAGTMDLAAGLRALNEMGATDVALSRKHLSSADDAVAREAMIGYASSGGPEVVADLAKRWAGLPGPMRQFAMDGMLKRKETAAAFAKVAAAGEFGEVGSATLERLVLLLGTNHPAVGKLLQSAGDFLRPVIRLDGQGSARVATNVTLEGPFTVEGWIRLDPGIDNADNFLGRKGGADFNFFGEKFRIYDGRSDRIVANHTSEPNVWTHYAVTRDAQGRFRIYVDGELDQDQGTPHPAPMRGLNLGESTPPEGSKAAYQEVRIWDHARNADQIRANYQTSYLASDAPRGLTRLITGGQSQVPLEGGARMELTTDFPVLQTPARAREITAKFERFRVLASKQGDPAAGKTLATATCLICHQVNGEGMQIGPDLSGAGAMGVEGLLRNILTPSAQLESGYYRHDVTLRDGTLLSGFLVKETEGAVTLRQIGADDRVVPRSEIASHKVSKQSLMPEGLIDGLNEKQVADLFSYLKGLK